MARGKESTMKLLPSTPYALLMIFGLVIVFAIFDRDFRALKREIG